jgi:chromosome segregation ATPase
MTEPQVPKVEPTDVDTVRHLRVLEERFMNLRRKAQLNDEKLLSAEQKLNSDIKSLTQELVQLRRTIADLQDNLAAMQNEMKHAASQYDLKALEKYVGYWEPMQFVTKEEVMRKQNLLKHQPRG